MYKNPAAMRRQVRKDASVAVTAAIASRSNALMSLRAYQAMGNHPGPARAAA